MTGQFAGGIIGRLEFDRIEKVLEFVEMLFDLRRRSVQFDKPNMLAVFDRHDENSGWRVLFHFIGRNRSFVGTSDKKRQQEATRHQVGTKYHAGGRFSVDLMHGLPFG